MQYHNSNTFTPHHLSISSYSPSDFTSAAHYFTEKSSRALPLIFITLFTEHKQFQTKSYYWDIETSEIIMQPYTQKNEDLCCSCG